MNCTAPESGWCGSGAVGAPPPRRAVEPSTEPQAGSRRRASGIVRDDGRLAMSISAHAARGALDLRGSAAAKAAGSRQRFAGCRVGEYMSVDWSVVCTNHSRAPGRRPTSATPKKLRILPRERRAPYERAELNGRVGCRRGGGWGGWGHPGRLTLRSSAPPLPLTAPGVGPHPQPAQPGVGSRGESRVRPAPPPSSGYCDPHISPVPSVVRKRILRRNFRKSVATRHARDWRALARKKNLPQRGGAPSASHPSHATKQSHAACVVCFFCLST